MMISTEYSDTTPDVVTSYDNFGRTVTVKNGVGTLVSGVFTIATPLSSSTFAYDPTTLVVDTETITYDIDTNGTPELTRVIDRKQDSLLRDKGFDLKNGTILENQALYDYFPSDGRLVSVGRADISPVSFSYGYTPNSNLLETVTGPIHTVTNVWEANRDVMDSKTNNAGTFERSKYDYAVNAIGQRTGVITSGTAFPNVPSWLWGYDQLGQVVSADSSASTSDRAYEYDAIGNRKKSANSLTLPGTDNYSSNALNQYTAVDTLSPTYDLDGNASAYPLPSAPSSLNVLAWDGENRMISSTVGGSTTTYLYDARSRRIAKSTAGSSTIYLYDTWNCVAEYTQSTPTASVVLAKTRLWGTDLSGTAQGAGGVGGLLAEDHHSGTATTFYPTYDGNGNVSEYLDSSGQVTAHFEYDPFGNTVVTSGSIGLFDYRFSTKPRDSETGLYYYGYRYYDPLTGRWPSRDPIEEKGGIYLYVFVANDGIGNTDVLGLIVAENNCPEGKIKDPKEVQACLDTYNDQLEIKNSALKRNAISIAAGTTAAVATCWTSNLLNPAKAWKCQALAEIAGMTALANLIANYQSDVASLRVTFQACIDAAACICPVCDSDDCVMD